MVQLVRYNGIISGQQRFKKASIGIKAAGIQDRLFPAMELGNLGLQLLVNVLKLEKQNSKNLPYFLMNGWACMAKGRNRMVCTLADISAQQLSTIPGFHI